MNTAHQVRSPAARAPAARGFYSGDCRAQLTAFLVDSQPPEDLPHPLRGAALPHAGWMYSGRVAAHTLDCFRSSPQPEVVIIFGAVHDPGVLEHAIYPEGKWETPLGNIDVDKQCVAAVLAAAGDILRADPEAHRHEHSIEVLTPMVKYFFPGASIIPVMVLPQSSASRIGEAAAEGVSHLGRQAVYLAPAISPITVLNSA
jgi:AmmeMemoRadiSam system protein B